MTAHRFYLDTDVHPRLAVRLRRKGVDAVSAHECGMGTASDPEQLERATREGQTLVTFNTGHFVLLHGDYLKGGREHGGIVVSAQRPIGDVLRRLFTLMPARSPQELHNRLEYLSNWPPAAEIPQDRAEPG